MEEPCVEAVPSVYVCVCAHLLITCCYQRLATRPQVCIFPADWPQSASPPPAPWLAAQTGAPEKGNTQMQKVNFALFVNSCHDWQINSDDFPDTIDNAERN